MEAKCASGCGWRLYGSWVQAEKTFVIKRVGSLHSCNRSLTNRQATSTWLAREYMPKIRARLTYSATEMQTDARERAIWTALSHIRGPIGKQYDMLRSYLEELKRVSKNGTFMMEVNPATKVFERFYVGFDELKNGFLAGCRRVIGLDGCFLKTGLRGMLLCAIGRDGNNQMFPIAWAIVEVESEASWTWFLTRLFIDLNVGTGEDWTFISDKQKGLMNAVSWLSPQAEHRNCARHIYANWKKQHKGDALKNLFWRAVRCTFEADFDLVMADLKMECPKGYEDFMRQDPKHFCRAFIRTGTKCDAVENNLSETFNGYICIPRAKPILEMLEEIRAMLMERMTERSQLMVEGDGNRFVVDLARKTCACREWDISGISCRHAICCIAFMKLEINDYVDDCFKKDAYENCYKFPFPVMNGEKMWPKVSGEPIKPPPYRRKRGREKKNRIKDNDERSSDGKKLTKVGIQMQCSNCLQYGHNKKTCKNPMTSRPPKAKRGRPKKVDEASGAQASSQANRPSNRDSTIIRKERAQASALSSIILLSYHVYIVINVLCSFCFFRLDKVMDFSYPKLLGILT
ncbi:hypothetical protein ACJRO7_020885 [Eucalyptus globulus]|uniref:SWIM-type domain-containing protein n=1 Tax=Eucalyptus globulus TaxID=34317 RepID=A0ABD3KIT2_EUCGL